MKAANRRELDFKLVISALDTFMTHGEWDKAGMNVVSLWKMADEHGGEWLDVKALVIKYIKDWVETTDVKPAVYDKFFAVLILHSINVVKTFGVKKNSPSPRKSTKSKVKPDDIVELPQGAFTMPPQYDPTADFYPSDSQPPNDPTIPHD